MLEQIYLQCPISATDRGTLARAINQGTHALCICSWLHCRSSKTCTLKLATLCIPLCMAVCPYEWLHPQPPLPCMCVCVHMGLFKQGHTYPFPPTTTITIREPLIGMSMTDVGITTTYLWLLHTAPQNTLPHSSWHWWRSYTQHTCYYAIYQPDLHLR